MSLIIYKHSVAPDVDEIAAQDEQALVIYQADVVRPIDRAEALLFAPGEELDRPVRVRSLERVVPRAWVLPSPDHCRRADDESPARRDQILQTGGCRRRFAGAKSTKIRAVPEPPVEFQSCDLMLAKDERS